MLDADGEIPLDGRQSWCIDKIVAQVNCGEAGVADEGLAEKHGSIS